MGCATGRGAPKTAVCRWEAGCQACVYYAWQLVECEVHPSASPPERTNTCIAAATQNPGPPSIATPASPPLCAAGQGPAELHRDPHPRLVRLDSEMGSTMTPPQRAHCAPAPSFASDRFIVTQASCASGGGHHLARCPPPFGCLAIPALWLTQCQVPHQPPGLYLATCWAPACRACWTWAKCVFVCVCAYGCGCAGKGNRPTRKGCADLVQGPL
jgi:hypothetical protein